VAVVGSGPAGFYTAEHLLKREDLVVTVDMFERLPMPFGLVRFGVAPDHQKIKGSTKAFERVASRPEFRFFGNVDFGTHISLGDLQGHYHAICIATGAQTDRTEFVAWYNGHPDYRDYEFDLSAERVAVIGVGNVAVDVARIFARTTEELGATDIADHALAALRESKVREVFILGRRGPAQAAFTNAELKELGQLEGADFVIPAEDAALDEHSRQEVEKIDDRATRKKVELIQALAGRAPAGKPKKLVLRFLVSPTELTSDDGSHVTGMRLVRNALFKTEDGSLRPRATDEFEELPVDLVFRSVGYRGVPLPGIPFDERRGLVPNDGGRVISTESGKAVPGLYVSGWIKRGPSGIIGTNKPDAGETVQCILEDLRRGDVLEPGEGDPDAIAQLVLDRQPEAVSYDDWREIDGIEVDRGKAQGRPRVKFTTVREVLEAIGKA
jgi:ferredoxin--NADP+ reductase